MKIAKKLTPSERLIVSADFKPSKDQLDSGLIAFPLIRKWTRAQILLLADTLKGTGVCIKVNSALRALGYDLIDEIHSRGLRVFGDLKLFDIDETLSTDGVHLKEAKPELLTILCAAGSDAMRTLKTELPDTEVLAVTVLTNQGDAYTREMHGCDLNPAVRMLAQIARSGRADGLICSAKEATMLREMFGDAFTLNTPAIRPTWAIVSGDDQNPERIMTPEKAIKAGADRVIVGRPILNAKSPYDAVMRTLEEIASATS